MGARVAGGVVLLAAVLVTPARVAAAEWLVRDVRQHVRSDQLDVTGTLDPRWVGASIWYTVPLLADGLISPINDSLHVEAGGHFMTLFQRPSHGEAMFGLLPLVGPRWSFHLTTEWTGFATVKAGYEVLLGHDHGPKLDGSIGAYWHSAEDVWLRLEIGARGMLRVGVGIPM